MKKKALLRNLQKMMFNFCLVKEAVSFQLLQTAYVNLTSFSEKYKLPKKPAQDYGIKKLV